MRKNINSAFAKVRGNKNLSRKLTSNSLAERVSSLPSLKQNSLGKHILDLLSKKKNPVKFKDIIGKLRLARNPQYNNFNYSVKRVLLQLANHNYVKVMGGGDNLSFSFNKSR